MVEKDKQLTHREKLLQKTAAYVQREKEHIEKEKAVIQKARLYRKEIPQLEKHLMNFVHERACCAN